jgi:Protein of unknown function (DUF3431)
MPFVGERTSSDYTSSPLDPTFEIVAAHYREDLSWLKPVASIVTVYSKGNLETYRNDFPRYSLLPNIGRESHTYLHHIVYNYDTLADITLFTQGQIADHLGADADITDIVSLCSTFPHDVIAFNKHGLKYFNDWLSLPHVGKWKEEMISGALRPAHKTPGEFWEWLFGTEHPTAIAICWGAIFAVRREAIHRRPREFYIRILQYFSKVNHVNPEEGHYMERFWIHIFSPVSVAVPLVMPPLTSIPTMSNAKPWCESRLTKSQDKDILSIQIVGNGPFFGVTEIFKY